MSKMLSLRWMALLLEVGFSVGEAQDLLGESLDIPRELGNRELVTYLRAEADLLNFRKRSQRRAFLRRFGGIQIWAFTLAFFCLTRYVVNPPLVELSQAVNLSLPFFTKWLVSPNWYLISLCPILLWLLRNRSDEVLELEAMQCWVLLKTDATKALVEELSEELSLDSRDFGRLLVFKKQKLTVGFAMS